MIAMIIALFVAFVVFYFAVVIPGIAGQWYEERKQYISGLPEGLSKTELETELEKFNKQHPVSLGFFRFAFEVDIFVKQFEKLEQEDEAKGNGYYGYYGQSEIIKITWDDTRK
jgi:hypothetical protein